MKPCCAHTGYHKLSLWIRMLTFFATHSVCRLLSSGTRKYHYSALSEAAAGPLLRLSHAWHPDVDRRNSAVEQDLWAIIENDLFLSQVFNSDDVRICAVCTGHLLTKALYLAKSKG